MACKVNSKLLACFYIPTYECLSPQITIFNLVLRGTIFTEGGHYSPVNNVRGEIFRGDNRAVHIMLA